MSFKSKDFPSLFSKFLSLHPEEQWYTAHSHHFWHDCTQQAAMDYWMDSARLVDDKWDLIFSEKLPKTKKYLAQCLGITNPDQFVFAPNTHELVYRLLTTFPSGKKIKVLTSDSEFHSFSRQIKIFEENGLAEVTRLKTEPYGAFAENLQSVLTQEFDLIFFSHVFFNSGIVLDQKSLDLIYQKTKASNTLVVLDAYHSFMALPFSMRAYEDHFFYLAGSYKYAGAGEGFCFLYVPPKFQLKPSYSGWFADFSGLSHKTHKINYDSGASSMAGSTLDYSTMYKLLSIFEQYQSLNITQNAIHENVLDKQKAFLKALNEIPKLIGESKLSDKEKNLLQLLSSENIVSTNFDNHGHFFAFETKNPADTADLNQLLKSRKIYTDFRGSRIRFGFGIFQNWEPTFKF